MKGLDCLISPADGTGPYKEGEVSNLIVSVFYAAIFNLIDFSSGVIPNVAKFTKCDWYVDEKWGEDGISKKVLASMEGLEDYPIGIQVSCLEEEKCLGFMYRISKIFHN